MEMCLKFLGSTKYLLSQLSWILHGEKKPCMRRLQEENCSAYHCELCLSPFKGLYGVLLMGVVFQYSTDILHTTQSNCCTGKGIVRAQCVFFLSHKLNSRYFTHLLLRKAAKSQSVRSSELPSHLRSAMPLKGCRLKASRLQSTIITLEVSLFRQDTSCGKKKNEKR